MGKTDSKNSREYRINGEIRGYDKVRIIGDNIESKVVSLFEAKKIAESMEMDMVEINNRSVPPIIRICNYDKFLYDQKKAEKKNKQTALPMKEIQLSANIAKHDIEVKANQARSFLEKGHKVKAVLMLKGREMTHREDNKKSIYEFVITLEDFAVVESMKDEGNKTVVILKKKK